MGLDMQLYAERYFWNFGEEADKALAIDIAQLIGVNNTAMPIKTIRLEAGRWRKANHIHKWFVDNVQNGKDECQECPVARGNLVDLREACREVLSDNTKAPLLLPTTDGFFFGGKDYNQWYFADLDDTIKIIDNALSLPGSWDFTYRSSW